MSRISTLLRRILMIALVVSAFYVTYIQLTGISSEDILDGAVGEVNAGDARIHEAVIQEEFSKPKMLDENASLAEAIADIEANVIWDDFPSEAVLATGYTAGVESTGKEPGHPAYGITFSGVPVARDVYSTIAADPAVFPIGTILFIPGYGYGVVADTGSAIQGERIDLYYDTVNEVYEEWGKKEIEVYIMKEGVGTLSAEEFESLNDNRAIEVFTPPL